MKPKPRETLQEFIDRTLVHPYFPPRHDDSLGGEIHPPDDRLREVGFVHFHMPLRVTHLFKS